MSPRLDAPSTTRTRTIRISCKFAVARQLAPLDIAQLFVDLQFAYEVSHNRHTIGWPRPLRARPPAYVDDWEALQFQLFLPGGSALRVVGLRYGSPLEILLELPATVQGVTGFVTATGLLCGARFTVGKYLHKERAAYWEQRLTADRAQAAYFRWRRVETRLSLESVDFPDGLPEQPSDEPEPPARRRRPRRRGRQAE